MSPLFNAAALQHSLASGHTTASALTEHCLAQIAQAPAGVFTEVLSQRALQAAEASTLRWAAGRPFSALDGLPLVVKDLVDLRASVTTAASATRRLVPASPQDAAIIERLCAAGMVPVAKTNLSEFAFSGLGVNPHFGTPDCAGDWLEPGGGPAEPPATSQGSWRAPGGSSSGSAVAVARGYVPWALGSDTSGSARIPCAWNGLVGMRPSAGRYPAGGVFPLSPTLDVLGPMAGTVRALRWLDAAMSGALPPGAELPAEPALAAARPTVIVPEGSLLQGLEPVVARAFEAALAALEAAGWQVRVQALPVIDAITALQARLGTLVGAEAAQVHARLLASDAARQVHWPVLRRLVLAAHMPVEAHGQLLQARAGLCADWRAQVGESAVVAVPTTAITAPLLQPLLDDADHFALVNGLALRNTLPSSFVDAPSISLPLRRRAVGAAQRPGVGLMLSTVAGQDDRLLGWAAQAEADLQAGLDY